MGKQPQALTGVLSAASMDFLSSAQLVKVGPVSKQAVCPLGVVSSSSLRDCLCLWLQPGPAKALVGFFLFFCDFQ